MIRFRAGGLRSPFAPDDIDRKLFGEFITPPATKAFEPPPPQERDPICLTSTLTRWPVRDQGVSAMCVPYAAAACIELRRALQAGSTIPDRLSAGFLYWACRRQEHDADEEGVDKGRVSFGDAVRALRDTGICSIDACPDALGVSAPSRVALATATRFPKLAGAVRRFPGKAPEGDEADKMMRHIIDIMLFELRQKYPVGLGFPIYPTNGNSTNWNDAGEGNGTVQFPFDPDPKCHIGGHAVCVTGFQPSADEESGGGYFLFRNSVGRDFAIRHAIPGLTGYGDGRVSISDIQRHAWGFFTLRGDNCIVTGALTVAAESAHSEQPV
jgi:hypothetical protein